MIKNRRSYAESNAELRRNLLLFASRGIKRPPHDLHTAGMTKVDKKTEAIICTL